MTRSIFAPIRSRKDGSVFTARNSPLRELFGKAFFVLLISLIFAAIVIFGLAGPFGQATDETHGMGGPEFEFEFENEPVDQAAMAAIVEKLSLAMPVEGKFTSSYGSRSNPFGGSSSEFHKGLDIAAPRGTPVRVSADGEVTFSGWQRGYGNIVIVRHSPEVSTRYAHLSRRIAKAGDAIKGGELLGEVGSTGRSTGPHLHYEIRVNERAVNPSVFLPKLVEAAK